MLIGSYLDWLKGKYLLSGNSSLDKFCDTNILDLTWYSHGNSMEEREDIGTVLFSESLHSAILKQWSCPLPAMIYSVFKREDDWMIFLFKNYEDMLNKDCFFF